MAWIELHDTLPDHDKVITVAEALKMDKDLVVGKLVRLWTWAINNREDGRFRARDVETIAEVMRVRIKPQRLVDALVEARLLDFDGETYTIHGWDERVGMLLAKRETARAKTRERVQRHRKAAEVATQDVTPCNASCNADVTCYVTHDVTLCNSATVPKPYIDDDEDEEEELLRTHVRLSFLASVGRNPTAAEEDAIANLAAVRGKTELIGEAIRRASLNGARSIAAYVAGIVKEWDSNGIDTADELAEYDFLRDCAAGKIRTLDPGDALTRISNNRAEKLKMAAD